VTRHYAHRPVLLEESLSLLNPRSAATFVDGTLGGGGHAQAILERSAPDGQLVGLDVDDVALAESARRLAPFGPRVRLIRASFRDLERVLAELGLERVDGVILDLGLSSGQLDDPQRGFRFAEEGAASVPLDMRLDRRLERSASDLLAEASFEELAAVFQSGGELPGARRLARRIAQLRERAPLRTASDLRAAIQESGVGRGRRHHPATLVFQALRIAVNDELRALEEGIEAAIRVLSPGGRLVILAYHSLEDRIVKQRFRAAERGCSCPPRLPRCICGERQRLRVLTRKPISAPDDELRANPRARSARLRAAERVAEAA
jgi:16S rRNA (cytosine1402-N4)-methyltransferase